MSPLRAQALAGGTLGDLGPLEDAPVVRLAFVVPGAPVPKARARVVLVPGGKARAFTPGRTTAYESAVAAYALQARQLVAAWPLGARYRVEIEVRRAGRGDLDNIAKAALDACNGVLWKDDSQVDDIHAWRAPLGMWGERLDVRVEVM